MAKRRDAAFIQVEIRADTLKALINKDQLWLEDVHPLDEVAHSNIQAMLLRRMLGNSGN